MESAVQRWGRKWVFLQALGLLFVILLPVTAQKSKKEETFPASWQGDWKGRLHISSPAGKTQDIPMEIHIHPIKGRKAFLWEIVYGEGEKKQVRSYELLPDEKSSEHFVVDEKNGILLDASLIGSSLYSQFQVSGSLLSSRYEIRGDRLHFEITSYALAEPRKTGVKDSDVEVLSFKLLSVQTAELTRK